MNSGTRPPIWSGALFDAMVTAQSSCQLKVRPNGYSGAPESGARCSATR